MSQSFDHLVAYHCASTLMGHKAGSLFGMKRNAFAAQQEKVESVFAMLEKKGLYGHIIHCADEIILIYVYRKELLQRHLFHPLSRALLDDHGYTGRDTSELISQLVKRLTDSNNFPHEIGLFLGYPPEDVEGFVKHKGKNCKHSGCWKVYGDVGRSKALFIQYATCRMTCINCIKCGMTLEQVVPA